MIADMERESLFFAACGQYAQKNETSAYPRPAFSDSEHRACKADSSLGHFKSGNCGVYRSDQNSGAYTAF
jgi:hypothetical protein